MRIEQVGCRLFIFRVPLTGRLHACLGRGRSVFLKVFTNRCESFFEKRSVVRSISERRQLCWVPDAAVGGVWVVSYYSGPCIPVDS